MEPIRISYWDYAKQCIKTETIIACSLTEAIAEFRIKKNFSVLVYSASYERDPIKIIYK